MKICFTQIKPKKILSIFVALTATSFLGAQANKKPFFIWELDQQTQPFKANQSATLTVTVFDAKSNALLWHDDQAQLAWVEGRPIAVSYNRGKDFLLDDETTPDWLEITFEDETIVAAQVKLEKHLVHMEAGRRQKAINGVDGSYLAQITNYLAGNVAELDIKGTTFSLKDSETGGDHRAIDFDENGSILVFGQQNFAGQADTSIKMRHDDRMFIYSPNLSIYNSGDASTLRLKVDKDDFVRIFDGLDVKGGLLWNTRLVGGGFINGDGGSRTNYVADFYNYNSGSSPDVLALTTGAANPGPGCNLIGFFSGSTPIGAIEGDSNGGITFKSGSADFAEYLPKLNPEESMKAGDVIGLFDGYISKKTAGAKRVMAVSSAPLVLGNDPGEDNVGAFQRVAMLGQVAVNVEGPVQRGDYLIPSGNSDGIAQALDPGALTLATLRQIIGVAWEDKEDAGAGKVLTAIGLHQSEPLEATIQALAQKVAQQQTQFKELQQRMAALEAKQAPSNHRCENTLAGSK